MTTGRNKEPDQDINCGVLKLPFIYRNLIARILGNSILMMMHFNYVYKTIIYL